ncbi:DUF4190 domain-containing protein [Streptomyces sp. cmx-18-6]|uniref:DUF4190 domain-containing protein n=1 Tax=Streptomyces sp. cmx-18-6 TaxID=2790930 RepID=UPI00397F12CD
MSIPSYPQEPSADRPQYSSPEPARSNGFAVTALILGLVACLLFWTIAGGLLLGVLAVVFGVVAVLRTRQGRAPRRVMAIVGAALGALGLIGSVVVLIIAVSVYNSPEFKEYERCAERANSQPARDRCAEDLGESLFR